MEAWERELMLNSYDPSELRDEELVFYNGFKYAIECCETAFANIEESDMEDVEGFVIDWLRHELLQEVTVSLMEDNLEKYGEE